MKKRSLLLVVATALLSVLFLSACSNSTKEQEKYYDSDFMSSLEKGLENRWAYTNNKSNADEVLSKKGYTTATQKELEQIKKYQNLKFKNSKLQEAALAYINELKEGLSVAKTYGSKSFDENWSKHYDARTSKLIAINAIKKIKVSSKYQDILDELLASGKEVNQNNKNKEKLTNFVKTIAFTKDEAESSEDYFYYTATVENTTGLKISNLGLSIKLIDDQGVTIDTQTIFIDSWDKNEKRKLEFSTSETFSSMQVSLDDYYKLEE